MIKRLMTLSAAVAATGLAVIATASSMGNLKGSVKIDGSSTVYPISEAVAEEFRGVEPGVTVTVGLSGTGGGFKKFVAGEIDIADASRPITKEENAKCTESQIEYIELPIAYDGLSFVTNKKNTWAKDLTVDEIKEIFLDGSTVKTWKDVRADWPATPLTLFIPGTDSGTFDYFKEVVAGKEGKIRADVSVSEDDNVLVRGVQSNEGALGFFGCAYYFENADKLNVLAIDGGKGAVMPSSDSIEGGTYAPFSRPLFIYVNKKSAERPEVKAFVAFYLEHAGEMSEEVGYVQLPSEIYSRVTANFAKLRTGTQFWTASGEKVSGPLAEIYK